MAIALGVILIFDPSRSQGMLVNLMGFFWLTSGVALIRRPDMVRVLGKRTSVVVGVVAILTGLLVVTRHISRQWMPEIVVVELLGAVILLAGVLHMLGQFRVGQLLRRRHDTLNFLLGLFEFAFGLMLVWSPLEHGPLTYWVATVWALVFGVLIIGDALVQRFKKPSEAEAATQPERPESIPATDEG
jgi:uncharacterized membrane protein HdeD (DUF308 family)